MQRRCRETKKWVFVIDDLFTKVFGDDFLKYDHDNSKGTVVSGGSMSKIHRYQNGFWEEVDKEHGSPAFDSTCPKQLESQFSEAELADVSNANSATQVPHTEDVPMDWSDSGGMQSPQTKVNYDVELPKLGC